MGGVLSCSELIQKFVEFWNSEGNQDCKEKILQQICHAYGGYGSTGDQTKISNCMESSGFHLIELNTASTTYGLTTEEVAVSLVIIGVSAFIIWKLNKKCTGRSRRRRQPSRGAQPEWLNDQSFRHNLAAMWGVDYHPRMMLTDQGRSINEVPEIVIARPQSSNARGPHDRGHIPLRSSQIVGIPSREDQPQTTHQRAEDKNEQKPWQKDI